MNYIKVIRMSGSFFAREFKKKPKYEKNIKYREVSENTVLEQFLAGNCSVEIFFEDTDKNSIVLNRGSDPNLIKKYLGSKFVK